MTTIHNNMVLSRDFQGWSLVRGNTKFTTQQKIKDLVRLERIGIHLNFDEFNDYIQDLIVKGKSTSYVNHQISSVRTYTHFLEEKGLPFDEKLSHFKFLKIKTGQKEIMSLEEIDRFLNLTPPRGSTTFDMWTLFFYIVAFTGMRTGEASKLTVQDIDFGANVFILRDTKTHDTRRVPIPKPLVSRLETRISEVKDGYLFPSTGREGHMVGSNWTYSFRERLKRLGIARRGLTAYSLRHSYITEMLETEGVNIFDVQSLVGHRRLETTRQYYHLGTKRIQRVSEKYPGTVKDNPTSIIQQIGEAIKRFEIDRNPKFNQEVAQKAIGEFISQLYASIS